LHFQKCGSQLVEMRLAFRKKQGAFEKKQGAFLHIKGNKNEV